MGRSRRRMPSRVTPAGGGGERGEAIVDAGAFGIADAREQVPKSEARHSCGRQRGGCRAGQLRSLGRGGSKIKLRLRPRGMMRTHLRNTGVPRARSWGAFCKTAPAGMKDFVGRLT